MPTPTAESRVGDVSEGDLLDWITASIAAPDDDGQLILGVGDDAAILRFDGDAVATVDTLVHGPDFRHAWSSGYDIGWKAAAVNLADVAAMGAEPTALLVALTLPPETTLGYVADLYRGLRDACRELAEPALASVVGGDVTVSPTLTIGVTALGRTAGAAPVLRSGARAGDVIALAGEQGPAGLGIRLMFDRFTDDDGQPIAIDETLLSAEEAHWVSRQRRPRPPLGAGRAAAHAGAHAMMDVSDGLMLDARRIARASGIRLDLHTSALGDNPQAALVGGEDHGMLAAFAADAALPEGFRVIGRAHPLADGESGRVTVDGSADARRGGWDPYQDWDDSLG